MEISYNKAMDLLQKIWDNISEEHDCYGFYYGEEGFEIYEELREIFDPEAEDNE